jgi:hypothetical protein
VATSSAGACHVRFSHAAGHPVAVVLCRLWAEGRGRHAGVLVGVRAVPPLLCFDMEEFTSFEAVCTTLITTQLHDIDDLPSNRNL